MPTKYKKHSRTLLITVPPDPIRSDPIPSNSRLRRSPYGLALDPEGTLWWLTRFSTSDETQGYLGHQSVGEKF